jgi:hypothetical protein
MGSRSRRFALLVMCCALLGPAASASAADPVTNCDPLDPAACMLPFPNDYFTKADPSTPTGLRIDFRLADMPRNVAQKPIDPSEFNRNDGFSPGQEIVTNVPGLGNQKAFDATGAVPISDVARSFDPDQPVVVIDANTLRRQLIWSEVDANPAANADRNLLIHPAVNWTEGHHYIVALRDLRDATGAPLAAQPAFRHYRDRIGTGDAAFEARRPHMEWVFGRLQRAGIERRSLYLAWDFTVASQKSLSERALHMRDDAFAGLGDPNLRDMKVEGSAPPFVVTQTTDFTTDENANIAREVQGQFLVPCYLNLPGCPPGATMSFAPGSDTPLRLPGNTMAANFDCLIPRAAAGRPARPSLYGHGLFGSAGEVTAGNVEAMANEHDFVFCATDWIGMSESDLPNAFSVLADLSRFNTLPDRMQQAYLNFMFLGRLMIHPDGFPSSSEFQIGGHPAIDPARLFYDGNSQGGIEGGALTALAPDFNRAVLGVPAMNYSLLIRRSSDFDPFAAVLYKAYPSELERPLIISMLQMLWDRGDANGYAQHMTSRPYANTPAHKVLLEMAFGDHQVTNWATEVEARTIGARLRTPALDPGRSPEVSPYFGIPPIGSFPFDGSALVVWDIGPVRDGGAKGTDPPPTGELADRGGQDPHGAPRADASNRVQKSEFLRVGGSVVDVCGDHPCYAGGWTGPGG